MVSFRIAPIVTAACLTAAGLALSFGAFAGEDEIVAANTRAAALPTSAAPSESKAAEVKPASTKDQFISRLATAPHIDRADSGVNRASDSTSGGRTAPRDTSVDGRTIHGSAGVSVGTGGYRSAYVTSVIPVGENGTLGISVSQTDFGKNAWPVYGYDGYGHGYGDGYYGTGYGDYAGYGARRGGSRQSFGLSYESSDGEQRSSDTPDGCAPGFRDNGRYIEPVWVTQARGNRSCTSAEQP